MITSRQHPIVKEFRELARGGGSSMLLDGWHLLTEAVSAGVAIETVALCGSPTGAELITIDRARRSGANILDVSDAVLNALSPMSAPTGVVASAKKPLIDGAEILQPAPALVLAAVGIQDPGNTGALIRSAAAAGSTGVVVDEATADPWGWKALRASMGSVFHLPVIRTRALAQMLDDWHIAGIAVIAAVPRHGTPMYHVDFRKPSAILVGSEGAGLPGALVDAADSRVSIPMHGETESLNVAVAAALLLYEAHRQRSVGESRLAPFAPLAPLAP